VVELGPVLDDPAEVAPADWVLLAVKAHQTADARGWLRQLIRRGTVVAVLQNGVEHRARVEPFAATAELLPAVIRFGAERTAPSRVTVHARPTMTVPDCEHGRAFASLLDAGAEVELTGDFLTAAWRKLCHNAVAGLMALVGRSAELFREAEMHALALRLAEECAQVGRAEGADLPPGFAHEVVDGYLRRPPGSGSSILADRIAGRPLEWDARNGVIRRLGARHRIPTPVSDVLVPLLASS
jgi:2-dehydropantoate 2-reductase